MKARYYKDMIIDVNCKDKSLNMKILGTKNKLGFTEIMDDDGYIVCRDKNNHKYKVSFMNIAGEVNDFKLKSGYKEGKTEISRNEFVYWFKDIINYLSKCIHCNVDISTDGLHLNRFSMKKSGGNIDVFFELYVAGIFMSDYFNHMDTDGLSVSERVFRFNATYDANTYELISINDDNEVCFDGFLDYDSLLLDNITSNSFNPNELGKALIPSIKNKLTCLDYNVNEIVFVSNNSSRVQMFLEGGYYSVGEFDIDEPIEGIARYEDMGLFELIERESDDEHINFVSFDYYTEVSNSANNASIVFRMNRNDD